MSEEPQTLREHGYRCIPELNAVALKKDSHLLRLTPGCALPSHRRTLGAASLSTNTIQHQAGSPNSAQQLQLPERTSSWGLTKMQMNREPVPRVQFQISGLSGLTSVPLSLTYLPGKSAGVDV